MSGNFKLGAPIQLWNAGYGHKAGEEGFVITELDAVGRVRIEFNDGDKVWLDTLDLVEVKNGTITVPKARVAKAVKLTAAEAAQAQARITKVPKSVDMSEFEIDKVSDDKPEAVNHPAHYGGDTPYEAIKVIEAWELGFNLGNSTKYIARLGKKHTEKRLEELKKARWYIDREIMLEEAK